MSNTLNPNEQLTVDQTLKAENGRSHLVLQSDGNLVLYRDGTGQAVWASNTPGSPVNHAVMQTDGNFVAYDGAEQPFWATGTDGHPGSRVMLQDDGNLVVYGPGNVPLWASNTPDDWDPFTAESGDVHVGTGEWMSSVASVASTGLISGSTRTWCTKLLAGFHGSVVAVLLDESGRTIWPTNPQATKQQYGVDGVWIGTHDRTDAWAVQADPAVLAKAKSLAFVHFLDPKNMFLADLPILARTVAEVAVIIAAAVA